MKNSGTSQAPIYMMFLDLLLLLLFMSWTEEPGGPQSMESQRVGHDLSTEHSPTFYVSRI